MSDEDRQLGSGTVSEPDISSDEYELDLPFLYLTSLFELLFENYKCLKDAHWQNLLV
jgi:hypothetical protein